MATIQTAAVSSIAFAALLVGHHLGDHPVQRNADVHAKAAPDDQQLADGKHPWTGWPACLRHVATYTLAQAAALAFVSLAAPLALTGVLAALAVSASTHAVIDRRWIVQAIIHAKQAEDWPDAPYQIDQALHRAVLLVAAVLAAAVDTTVHLAATTAASLALVVAALAIERLRARSAATRIGDPTRL
jgi:hypothetical protein